MSGRPVRRERGFATFAVTLALLVAITLATLYAQRRHVDELRAAQSHVRSAQAFEAAEAGLAWATALLDEPAALDDRCLAGAGVGPSFRERHLAVDPNTGAVRALTVDRAGLPQPRRAACVHAAPGTGWQCACAGDDDPRPSAVPDEPAPGFVVRFEDAGSPGLVHLHATGCMPWPCRDEDDAPPGHAHVDATLGFLSGLAGLPSAAITARGQVDTGPHGFGVHNGDAGSGGLAVHAGGTVRGNDTRWSGPAGAPRAPRVANDAALGARAPQRLFASLFGLDKALWRDRAAVGAVACDGPCNEQLLAGLAHRRVVHLAGAVQLDGPITLGTPEQPVILVSDGPVELRGRVELHGLLHAPHVVWLDAPAGAFVRGALVSEGDVIVSGRADIVRDAAVLAALRALGTFAPMPGRWRDFR